MWYFVLRVLATQRVEDAGESDRAVAAEEQDEDRSVNIESSLLDKTEQFRASLLRGAVLPAAQQRRADD